MTIDPKLNAAAIAAVASNAATGVPALVSMAQWAIESGWGAHSPGNNCFGVKTYPGCLQQLLKTNEWFTPTEAARFLKKLAGRKAEKVTIIPPRKDKRELYHCEDWFAAFSSLTDCFVKHGQLLSEGQPYMKAFAGLKAHGDAELFAQEIAPIYATDPDYGVKILTLMRSDKIRAAVASVQPPPTASARQLKAA